MIAKGIVEDRQKVASALLLYTAGREVQDLYHGLAGPEDELRDYENVVEPLHGDFVAKVNAPFERHVFRQVEKYRDGRLRLVFGENKCKCKRTARHCRSS